MKRGDSCQRRGVALLLMLLLSGLQQSAVGTRTATARSSLGYTVALAAWKRATDAGLECPKPEKCDCRCDCSVSATIFPTKASPAPCVPIPLPPAPVGGVPPIGPPQAPVYSNAAASSSLLQQRKTSAAPPMAAAAASSSLLQQQQRKTKASGKAPCATAIGEVMEESAAGKVLQCAKWTRPNSTMGPPPPELCSYLCQLTGKCAGFSIEDTTGEEGGYCVLFESVSNPFDALEGNASANAAEEGAAAAGAAACSAMTEMQYKKAGSIQEDAQLEAAGEKATAFENLLVGAQNGGEGNVTELTAAAADAKSAAYELAMTVVLPALEAKTSTAAPKTTSAGPATTLSPLSWAARHPECPQGTPCNCDCRCRGPPHAESKKGEGICPPGFQPYVPEAKGAAGGKRADSLQPVMPR